VVVLNEKHLRRILRGYFRYYHSWRTHQALDMDAPAVERQARIELRRQPDSRT
jgi:hypothetical protein